MKVIRNPWWKTRPHFSADLTGIYKVIYIGWLCITWESDPFEISFSWDAD